MLLFCLAQLLQQPRPPGRRSTLDLACTRKSASPPASKSGRVRREIRGSQAARQPASVGSGVRARRPILDTPR
eukprot:3535417-Heterocapsa_arctica.AAC.1